MLDILFLLACPPANTKDTGTVDGTSSDDTAPAADGELTEADLLAMLPPCERVATDGAIDLDGSCLSGACLGMTYGEIKAVLGEPDNLSVWAFWEEGIIIEFVDPIDELTDESRSNAVSANSDYAGGTSTGLGIGATMSCFVEDLGTPDVATFYDVGFGLRLLQAQWVDLNLLVTDLDLTGANDAVVDLLGFEKYALSI